MHENNYEDEPIGQYIEALPHIDDIYYFALDGKIVNIFYSYKSRFEIACSDTPGDIGDCLYGGWVLGTDGKVGLKDIKNMDDLILNIRTIWKLYDEEEKYYEEAMLRLQNENKKGFSHE